MSDRDNFAAAALPALITMAYSGKVSCKHESITEETIALQAYAFADAMIKVRDDKSEARS